jgi:hypothetical protein
MVQSLAGEDFPVVEARRVVDALVAEVPLANRKVICRPSRSSLRSKTPFRWLYFPVMIEAREGEQIEFVQKQLSSLMPSLAIRSMCGVSLMTLPYAPIACAAWSSVMM